MKRKPNLSPLELKEYYTGEFDYVLLRALKSAKANLDGTNYIRQQEILDYLIAKAEAETNALKAQKFIKEKKEFIRSQYNKIKSERDMRNLLGTIGFELERNDKHKVFIWNNNSKYTEVYCSTPTDFRGFYNAITDTFKKIFGTD